MVEKEVKEPSRLTCSKFHPFEVIPKLKNEQNYRCRKNDFSITLGGQWMVLLRVLNGEQKEPEKFDPVPTSRETIKRRAIYDMMTAEDPKYYEANVSV